MTDQKDSTILAQIAELKEGQESTRVLIKDLKKELRGLVEIQKRLIHERLGVATPAPSNEYGEDSSSKAAKKVKNIQINDFVDGRICLEGNTFDYRAAIKSAGSAKWESSNKVWSLPKDALDQVIENFRALDLEEGKDFVVNVTRSEEVPVAEVVTEGFGEGFKAA